MALGLFLAIAGLALAIAVAIRAAPSDPAVWHVAISDGSAARPGPCADQIRTQADGARAVCLLPGSPVVVLQNLAAIAMAYPRTVLLAGSATEGRMTWVSRSKIMGFPDYITAETTQTPEGTRLDVFARLRFGNSDLGVNAARLQVWLRPL